MEMIGTEEALASILQFSKHASAKVKTRVAQLAAKLGNRAALDTVKRLILDDDHAVRRRALSSLVEISGDGAVQSLLDLFTSKEFHDLNHESKLSMLLVIRSLSARGQQEVIRGMTGMRRFFKRGPLEDTKISLIEIMHLMDKDTALDELSRLRESCAGRMLKAVEAALEKTSHEQPVA